MCRIYYVANIVSFYINSTSVAQMLDCTSKIEVRIIHIVHSSFPSFQKIYYIIFAAETICDDICFQD